MSSSGQAARPGGAGPITRAAVPPGLPPVARRGRPGWPGALTLVAAALRAPGAVLNQADFVIVDVETTGWQPGRAALTEIGAVRLRDGQVTAEFSALVNPGMPVPAGIAELTGITDDMVRDAPGSGDVLPQFLDFAAGSIVTAHNSSFDMAFLADACHRHGIGWRPGPVMDTVVLAGLVLWPTEVADRKLATLAAHFGTATVPSHRALADARATAEVLARLIALLQQRGQAGKFPRAALAAARLIARIRLMRWPGRRAGTLHGGRRTTAGAGARQAGTHLTAGGGNGHGDRADQGQRGAHPGDRVGDSPDPSGQRGLFGDRGVRPGRDGSRP